MNLNVVELEKKIIDTINESNVNFATISLILDKLNKEVKRSLEEALIKEKEYIEQQKLNNDKE